MRRLRSALVALAMVVGSVGSAGAQPSEADLQRARDLFGQAEKAEAGEKWQVALDLLVEVAAIKTTGVVLYHMGICEERLGRVGDALAHFQQSEALAREQGAAQIQQLAADRAAKTEPRVPRLKLTIEPTVARTEVLLDGKPAKVDDAGEIRLNPNRPYKLTVRAPGRRTVERQVFLNEGVADALQITLEVARPAAAGSATTPVAPPPDASPRRAGPPLGTWIAGGAAVALAAGGVVAFAVSGSKSSDGEEICSTHPAPPAGGEAKEGQCDPSTQDTIWALDRLALGLWIGSAAAVGVGVTLWVLDAKSQRTSGTAGSPNVSLQVRGTGAQLRGRF